MGLLSLDTTGFPQIGGAGWDGAGEDPRMRDGGGAGRRAKDFVLGESQLEALNDQVSRSAVQCLGRTEGVCCSVEVGAGRGLR